MTPPAAPTFANPAAVPAELWPWPHFTPAEWRCRGSGIVSFRPDFMDKLEFLRAEVGAALPVISGYRSPDYNARVSTTGPEGPHTTGRAVDLAVGGELAFRVVAAGVRLGFTGIGLKQKGPWRERFVHLDDLPPGGHPRPRFWTY